MTINVMQGHWYWRHSKEHVRHSISHPLYLCLSFSVSELFDVKEHRDLKIYFQGHSTRDIMQGLYITEIYRPEAIPLPLIVCVCLCSLLHSELRK